MRLDWLEYAWDQIGTVRDTFDVMPEINDEGQIECAEDIVKILRELADVIDRDARQV